MQLTSFSDYALRLLMFLGLHPERLVTITEVARAFDISQNHLMKVVNFLAGQGLVRSVRGKTGGITLAKDPNSIRIGDVIRLTEPHLNLVECFDPENRNCCIRSVCSLRHLLQDGLEQFLAVLNQRTLADLVRPREEFIAVLPASVRAKPSIAEPPKL